MADLERIVDDLVMQGWSVVQNFLPPRDIAELLADARRLRDSGQMRRAGVGRGEQFTVSAVRGDSIYWLDPAAYSAAQQKYVEALERLLEVLNRELFLGLVTFEAFFGFYPPGAGYEKHIDRFSSADERSISCVLYLNPDWNAGDGGELRLYLPDGSHDVRPTGGTLVVFRSESVEHEVLPARHERYSLTGWLKRRSGRL